MPHFHVQLCLQDANGTDLGNMGVGHTISDVACTFHRRVMPLVSDFDLQTTHYLSAALENAGHPTSLDGVASTYGKFTPPPPGFDLQVPCCFGPALEDVVVGHHIFIAG